MTNETRIEVAKIYFEKSIELLTVKGRAYAGNEDALSNFKRNAERLGLSKYQIWAVYFNKHIDSINNAIKYSPEFPVDESEGLEGRIEDAITYLVILGALLAEDKHGEA